MKSPVNAAWFYDILLDTCRALEREQVGIELEFYTPLRHPGLLAASFQSRRAGAPAALPFDFVESETDDGVEGAVRDALYAFINETAARYPDQLIVSVDRSASSPARLVVQARAFRFEDIAPDSQSWKLTRHLVEQVQHRRNHTLLVRPNVTPRPLLLEKLLQLFGLEVPLSAVERKARNGGRNARDPLWWVEEALAGYWLPAERVVPALLATVPGWPLVNAPTAKR